MKIGDFDPKKWLWVLNDVQNFIYVWRLIS